VDYKAEISRDFGSKHSNQEAPEWHFVPFRRAAGDILEAYFYYSCYSK